MTSEAQRIAIAEVCGWKPDFDIKDLEFWLNPDGEFCSELPDYLNDLNEIRSVEVKIIFKKGWSFHYESSLDSICERDWRLSNAKIPRHVLHATASQRSEAFLKTLNIWDDSK